MASAGAAGATAIAPERVQALAARMPERPQGVGPTCAQRDAWTTTAVVERTAEARRAAEKLLDRAMFAAAGEHFIQNYVSGFSPEGYTSEGPGYWVYGFSHFAVLREMLMQASGGQSGNDAPLAKAALLLFAAPRLVAADGEALAHDIGLHSYFDSVGVLVSRPDPGGDLAVSIKAGGNGNHSHNDIGSYTVGLGTEQPTGDVGSTRYSAKTFSKERYTIPAISSWGHPVPVVAGALQAEADKITPKVLATRFSETSDAITINMADAYTVPVLRSLTRTLVHARANQGFVTVTDRFAFSRPSTFEVAITTLGNWKQNADGSIDLWQKSEHLRAHIESSSAWTLRAENSNEEGLAFTRLAIALDSPQNSGYMQVRFERAPP
jgi:hypothetical protein